MRGFLLDTNVISEIGKPEPDPQVITFLVGRFQNNIAIMA